MIQTQYRNNEASQIFKLAKKLDLPNNSVIQSIINFNNKITFVVREGKQRNFYQMNNNYLDKMSIAYSKDIIVQVFLVQQKLQCQEYLIVMQKYHYLKSQKGDDRNQEIDIDIMYMQDDQIGNDNLQIQLSSKVCSVFQMMNFLVIIEQNSVIHTVDLEELTVKQIQLAKNQNGNLRDAFIDGQQITLFYDQVIRLLRFNKDFQIIENPIQRLYVQYKQVFNFNGGFLLLDLEGRVKILDSLDWIPRECQFQTTNIMRIYNFENNISKFAILEGNQKNLQLSKFDQNNTSLNSTKDSMGQQSLVSVYQIEMCQIRQIMQIQFTQMCDYIYQSLAQTYYVGSNNGIYTLEKQTQTQISTSSQKQMENKSVIVTVKRPTIFEQSQKYPTVELIKTLFVPKTDLIEIIRENDQYLQQNEYGQDSIQQSYQGLQQENGSQILNFNLDDVKFSNNIYYLQTKVFIFICDDDCQLISYIIVPSLIAYLPHNTFLYAASIFGEQFMIRIYEYEMEEEIHLKNSIKRELKGIPNHSPDILKKHNHMITVATNNGFITTIQNQNLQESQISETSIDQVLVLQDKIITLSSNRFISVYEIKKGHDLKAELLNQKEFQGIQQLEIYDDQHLLAHQTDKVNSLLLISLDGLKQKKSINFKEEVQKLYCNNKYLFIIRIDLFL